MKVSKKTGKVKLEANEVRVGNFFVCREENHMKIQDLNGVFHVRVMRQVAIGIWLENMWSRAVNGDEGAINTLKTYIATMWSVYSVVPDDGFITDALRSAKDSLGRHPEWYGIKADVTAEEDADALEEMEGVSEFEGDVKQVLDKIDVRED